MATLYVEEFAQLGFGGGSAPVASQPSHAQQTVAIGGTTAQSTAFSSRTYFVRLHTDAICSVRFGTSPTATTSTTRMAANTTEYFKVQPGDKVAVISNT